MDKNILVAALAFSVLFGAGCQSNANVTADSSYGIKPYTTSSTDETKMNGRVIFSMTNTTTDREDVAAINLTLSKIEIHSEAEGWITIATTTKVFHLLALKAEAGSEFIGMMDVEAGTYNQVRMTVDEAKITMKNGTTVLAKIPSHELKFNGKIYVQPGTVSSVNIDVLADVSLHATGNGQFLFTPVIKMESRADAMVKISPDNTVVISEGSVIYIVIHGMDIRGEMKENFRLDESSDIEIKDGVLRLKSGTKIK